MAGLSVTVDEYLQWPRERREVLDAWLRDEGLIGYGVRDLSVGEGFVVADCYMYNKEVVEVVDGEVVVDRVQFRTMFPPPLPF